MSAVLFAPSTLRAAFTAAAAVLLSGVSHAQDLQVQPKLVAQGLEHPWSVAFLPDGNFLVTERPGRLRVVTPNGHLHPPVLGLPAIAAGGQGGLLDVVLDSDFSNNRTLYFCYAEPAMDGTTSTALAKARLSADQRQLENLQVIFSQKPKVKSQLHFGCRIVERSDGTLLLTLGERSHHSEQAQNLQSHLGKIVRLHKDGRVPADNPLVQRQDAWPEIWSWGHRSPQGAALAPDGTFWMNEHGPKGGDEINRPQAGKNYGWPVVSHGVHYNGSPVGQGAHTHPGMQPPAYQWTPSIAVSGMAFITSNRYPGWQGQMVVGALKAQRLERLTIQGEQITSSAPLLPHLGQRVRDVRQAPDGWLYILTDHPQGQLLRLERKE